MCASVCKFIQSWYQNDNFTAYKILNVPMKLDFATVFVNKLLNFDVGGIKFIALVKFRLNEQVF